MPYKKLTEKQAREYFLKYKPSMIGKNGDGYWIYPLSPKKAIYLKTSKNGKFKDAQLFTSKHEKRIFKVSTDKI